MWKLQDLLETSFGSHTASLLVYSTTYTASAQIHCGMGQFKSKDTRKWGSWGWGIFGDLSSVEIKCITRSLFGFPNQTQRLLSGPMKRTEAVGVLVMLDPEKVFCGPEGKQHTGDPIHLLHDCTATQFDPNISRPTSHNLTFRTQQTVCLSWSHWDNFSQPKRQNKQQRTGQKRKNMLHATQWPS